MISEHVYTAEVVGTSHRVSSLSGTVTLDESWSPYVQASLSIPLPTDPAVLAALDPRAGARVRLSLVQRFGSSRPVADVSADHAGRTLADLTYGWVSDVSAVYGVPYNAGQMRASTSRRLDLGVRECRVDYLSGRVDLDLSSDEAQLQDVALLAPAPLAPTAATVRAAVVMVLGQIGAVLTPGDEDAPLEDDAVYWQPGQSAWNYVAPLVQAGGLRLWCDEHRDWRLGPPLAATEGALALSGSTLKQLEDELSRDGGWFDGVVVTYRWTDSSGVDRVRHDVASTGASSRVRHVEYDRPWPGDGAAAALLERARARGRVEAASVVSNYDATPGQVLSVAMPGQPIQTGLVSRVEWDLGADEMQVRSRDLVDTPANAWSLIPPGVAWQDIPAGMSWPELNLQEV